MTGAEARIPRLFLTTIVPVLKLIQWRKAILGGAALQRCDKRYCSLRL
jgi:hypothetical protein